MATFSDETLMAFADGELDATTRAAVDAAMREDPEVAKRVAQHRALRAKLQLAYASELDEAPPERLLAAARAAATPKLEAVAGAGSVRQ
jgi:anti-sigma factor RsiW